MSFMEHLITVVMDTIKLEDFRHFYLAKSYDVVWQGTFRKHLCKCKEAGDPWAV